MKLHDLFRLGVWAVVSLGATMTYAEELHPTNKALHFDQPQVPISSIHFQHERELKPVANDFHIIQASYLSNDMGERWAFITFENESSGRRFLKNEAVVATFADGTQVNAHNLDETLKANERLTKAVFFGIHSFPIVHVGVE